MSEPQQGIFGIDLGTTYSVVGYIDETGRAAVTRNRDGDDTTPSVVFFETDDNVVVGKVAKESAGQYPDQVVSLIKREMGDRDYERTFFGKEYTPPSISAIILSALALDAEADTGRKADDVVITVPAYFGLLEKDATRQAGQIAGLNVIGIVPEPVAAALHYGMSGSADGTTFLVYDLGGGTFDISLIKMTDTSVEVLAVGGDHRLGGADWDEKLFDLYRRPDHRPVRGRVTAGRRGHAAGPALAGREDQARPQPGREQEAHRPFHRGGRQPHGDP